MRCVAGILLALVLVIGACGDDDEERNQEGMPNPASVFCVEQGGDLDIREGGGGQYGCASSPTEASAGSGISLTVTAPPANDPETHA